MGTHGIRLKSILAAAIVALMFIGMLPALGTIPKATALAERQEPTCQDGFGSPICVFLHPGITDASKPGWSHTLDTLWGTQDGATQRRQVFDNYVDYAILSSGSDSIGDLQFDIQVLETIPFIELYVPPEFKWLGPTTQESVWTDITNDHRFIDVSVRSVYDTIAPSWAKVKIGVAEDLLNVPTAFLTIEPGVYHIRLFDLRAPEIAGLYHFKVYVNGISIGAGNFPIMIVKSELNPAWVEATVRTELYYNPPLVSGYVMAEGTTPEGRDVKAMGYWGPNEFIQNVFVADKYGNGGAEYRTYLFGLAEGTYTLTAYATGAVPKVTDRFSVIAGQSYHSYMTVFDSPDIFVTIWSKHGSGELPWGNLWQLPFGTNNPAAAPDDLGPHRDILIELYDSDKNLAAFWASNALSPKKYFSTSNKLLGYHDDIVSGFAPGLSNRAMAGLIPTKTSYSAHLVDNFDLKLQTRGVPGTQWDGHVPWDTADYVNGILNGQYTLEAFVTGYIMDQADAYQHSFVVSGIDKTVPMDLRRSNWIEVAMHMPSAVQLSDITTVTLTAKDADGNEGGAIAFFATPAMSADGVIDGHDASSINSDGSYAGGIVIEGWNAVFPNVDDSDHNIKTKDYGLSPTSSTHSAGQVSLAGNPYTVSLYMADMGIPYQGEVGTGWYNIVGGDPQVSVFLCNSAQSLSFTIRSAWLKIGLRSVDFQVPAHSRPWTFPGAEIRVDFANATGGGVDTLDPIVYGLVQDPGTVQGIGFAIPGNPFGAEGVTPFDVDSVNDAGRHDQLAVTYTGMDWCRPGMISTREPIEESLFDPSIRSTRLPSGEYTLTAYTYGYVMRRSFPVQVPSEGGADIDADLIQGGQIRVTMDFKNEGVATDFNGFVRVEVFNANNKLVGASIYGQAEPNIFTRVIGGGAYLEYDEPKDWLLASVDGYTLSGLPEPAQGAGFDESYDTYPSASHSQRAFYSSLFYGVPADTWAGYANMNPSDANRLQVPAGQRQAFDVYGFYRYYGSAARTWAGGWPTTNGNGRTDYGLEGSIDIPNWPGSGGGLYSVKVWAFDPYGPDNMFESEGASDDWRMYSMATDLTNVQVPWGGSTELLVTMNNMATLRGTVRWFDMFSNLRPLPWAQVTASPGPGFDSYPAYASGLGAVGAGSSDSAGAYIMWLPAGTHDVSVSTSEAPQVWGGPAEQNGQYTVTVSDGWVGGGDTNLSHTEGVAVPELPSATLPISLLAAIAVTVLSLRRRTVHKSI